MGNCPPLPCPSPCPDLSFEHICANNNFHGCCIFHGCCNSKPSGVPTNSPPPPPAVQQLRHLPHLPPPPQPAGSLAKWATPRGAAGLAQDKFRPSPWLTLNESGLVATGTRMERGNGGVATPPDVPGDRRPPVPSSYSPAALSPRVERAWTTTCSRDYHDGRGVARNEDYRVEPVQPPPARSDSGLAKTWATGGHNGAGVAAPDMPLAAPLGVPASNGHPRPAGSGFDVTSASRDGGGVVPRHGDRRPPPSPWRTDESPGSAVTGATGRDDGWGVARSSSPAHHQPVATWRRAESGQDSSMECDTWAPASSRSRDPPHGRLLASSLSGGGRSAFFPG
ncbi:hypothetical protein HU200_064420 [Digitaria exilis]|uniref:Uncharacterized protein n=1 Tax=Digitaria exilis TaxID=1010633 RepID=A0A835DY98_9POAL|nr:hypothetical protein HU200_064420 [Digitaria exilis]